MNDVKAPSGPEDIPLMEFIKSFPIVVSIIDLATDKVIRTEHIDYGNHLHRKWLGKVTYYACTNGKAVETVAAKDYKE